MISGSRMEEAVKLTLKWYAETRLKLIQNLELSQPYGMVKLEPVEELIRFEEGTTEENRAQFWSAFIAGLYERYRGLPDAENRVNKDLALYVSRMFRLRSQVEAVQ